MSVRKYVEPELSATRVDAQWLRIAERMPAPRTPLRAARWSVVGGMALAVLLLVVWKEPWAPKTASVWEGSQVTSDDAPVDLRLSEGSLVELDPRSEVGLLQSAPHSVQLELSRGSARFEVAKKRERRFSVRSGDVEVRVTGTQFFLARTPTAEGERVRVSVDEGSVEVHRAGEGVVTLRAGEHWSTLIARPAVAASEAQKSEAVTVAETEVDVSSEGARPERRVRRPSGPSEAEALFEEANVARRAGLLRESASMFEELVQKHPKDRHAALSAFELGRMRMDSFADMRGAVTALERALALDARRSFAEDALARLALAHDALGDHKSCARARERYLARYAEGVHAQYLAGRCQSASGTPKHSTPGR